MALALYDMAQEFCYWGKCCRAKTLVKQPIRMNQLTKVVTLPEQLLHVRDMGVLTKQK